MSSSEETDFDPDNGKYILVDDECVILEVNDLHELSNFADFQVGERIRCSNLLDEKGPLLGGSLLWQFVMDSEDNRCYVVRLRRSDVESTVEGNLYYLFVDSIEPVERSVAEILLFGDRFMHLLGISPVPIALIDDELNLLFANTEFYLLLGRDDAANDRTNICDVLVDCSGLYDLTKGVKPPVDSELELVVVDVEGSAVRILVKVHAMYNYVSGHHEYALSVIDSARGPRRRSEVHLEQHRDPLTALLNRLGAEAAFLFLQSQIALDEAIALFFLDLDRFKIINDTKGHLVGDKILLEVASRLSGIVRHGDYVARLGGDEFIVVATGFGNEDDAKNYGRRISGALSRPIVIDGDEFLTSASVGLALCDSSTLWVDALRSADIAMYEAKAMSSDKVAIFDESFRLRIAERSLFESDLRKGVAAGEIAMVYQPIVSLATGKVTGFETLSRWRRADGVTIAPDAFISVAEDIGAIGDIGEIALLEAAILLRSFEDEMAGRVVTVNLSPLQLIGSAYKRLRSLLESMSDITSSIVVEVNESFSLNRGISPGSFRDDMRALGVRIAVDDFGTGFSSLAQIVELGPDIVKVDRRYVAAIEEPSHRMVVAAILALCEAVGATVVAEGVETVQQLRLLDALGCHMAQGFLFSKPVEVDEILSVTQKIESKPSLNGL